MLDYRFNYVRGAKLEVEMKTVKKCTRCGKVSTLSNFYRNKEGKLGRQSRCKNCVEKQKRLFRNGHRAGFNIGSTTHGMAKTPTYNSWQAMKRRCSGKYGYKTYKHIAICDEWVDSFETFYRDMGERPKRKTIDRRDNSKGYYKENCRWATTAEQNDNRSNTVRLTMYGVVETISNWARILEVPKHRVAMRYFKGWSDIDILTRPKRQRAQKRHVIGAIKGAINAKKKKTQEQ